MLNAPENWRIKNYKDLARACNIPAEKYESLQPPCALALFPTEEVIKDIVRRNPYYTVEKLFTDLRDMDRLDVINAISRYFVGKCCGSLLFINSLFIYYYYYVISKFT